MPVVDDESWLPIRDFVVELQEVVEGEGIIGKLFWSNCSIVDDDIFPSKVERDESRPIPLHEQATGACLHSDEFLTADEVEDYQLIVGFITERVRALWPFSLRGMLWCIYRGAYHVSMSLVLVIMIDLVWDPQDEAASGGEGVGAEGGAGDGAGDESQQQGRWVPGVKNQTILAAIASGYVLLATFLHSCTEVWVVQNAKMGLTGKQLRDWMVAQVRPVEGGGLRVWGWGMGVED